MGRLIALFALLSSPVVAWEFDPFPICTLSHVEEQGEIVVTYDPTTGIYGLSIELTNGVWPDAPSFGMLFAGPRSIRIGTDRHLLANDGSRLSVSDSGFGNVLDGLEFNSRAFAQSGDTVFQADLAGAHEKVQAFRNCGAALTS